MGPNIAIFDLLNLFPAKQKTTWLSSFKSCDKNYVENEKLNVFLQRMDIWEYFSTIKFVKLRHFQHENEKRSEKVMFPRGNVGGKKVIN